MHGPSGPRRGTALGEIGLIPDGALLIRNGVIEEYGASRRVENLANARRAREIDAAGRVVMPAFVDADTALAYPRLASRRVSESPRETPIRLLSKRTLEAGIAAAALDCVRNGILTVGAHTGHAIDVRNTMKVLRIQKALQGKPLRIRSILSPRIEGALSDKWFVSARRNRLSLMMDIQVGDDAYQRAKMAAHHDFSIRLRSDIPLTQSMTALAAEAGAAAIIAPGPVESLTALHVLKIREDGERTIRREIEAGVAIAIAGESSLNPQFLMQQAVSQMHMTPEEAITALTYNAACSLRSSNYAGSLEPGKPADLVIMDVPDYRDLFRRAGQNDVAAVLRQGHTVYRRAGLIFE